MKTLGISSLCEFPSLNVFSASMSVAMSLLLAVSPSFARRCVFKKAPLFHRSTFRHSRCHLSCSNENPDHLFSSLNYPLYPAIFPPAPFSCTELPSISQPFQPVPRLAVTPRPSSSIELLFRNIVCVIFTDCSFLSADTLALIRYSSSQATHSFSPPPISRQC